MSKAFRAVGIGSSLLVGTGVYSYTVQKKYPARGRVYQAGEKISVEGKKAEKVVVGYFGAESKVFDEGIDRNQGLYYGSKKTAQGYAINRSGSKGTPKVGVIVADRQAEIKDHCSGRYEGYDPLSPYFCNDAEVEIVEIEIVNKDNRLGTIASTWRMIDELGPKGSWGSSNH